MSTSRRLRTALITAATTLSLAAAGVPAATAAPIIDIDIVGINDFHGRIEANRASAGAAVLAGAVNAQVQANPNTLFVSAGDNIGASTFASFSLQDNPTIDALGTAGLTASAVGNHEFDQGYDDLAGRVIDRYAAATGRDGADFALGANVYHKGTTTPALREYAIREVSGISVGFIGTVTADTATLVSPAGISDLEFGSELEAANRVAAQLSDGQPANGEADVLVLLTHNGSGSTDCAAIATEDSPYGQLIREASGQINAIVSGHSHKSYDCQVPVAGGTDTRPVIQSHEYGTTLGRISLDVDAATGQVVGSSTARLPLAEQDPVTEAWSGLYPADAGVAAIVAAAVAESEVIGLEQIGRISADILRGGQVPGSDRGVESTLGNTVADIHLWSTSNDSYPGQPAQIAFMNPGGLRADLLYGQYGTVNYMQAANVQPFANTLVTMDMTGAQIRQVLEQQWPMGEVTRSKLHLGISQGLTYTYAEQAPEGRHVQQVLFQGQPMADDAVYKVVANSFLASGGDDFTAFAEAANHTDSGQIDLAATVNYFKSHDVVEPAPLGRAQLVAPAPEPQPGTFTLARDTLKQGQKLHVRATGLIEGAELTVTAFDGKVVVEPVPADKRGKTRFSLRVPADQPAGDYQLVISQQGVADVLVPFTVTEHPGRGKGRHKVPSAARS